MHQGEIPEKFFEISGKKIFKADHAAFGPFLTPSGPSEGIFSETSLHGNPVWQWWIQKKNELIELAQIKVRKKIKFIFFIVKKFNLIYLLFFFFFTVFKKRKNFFFSKNISVPSVCLQRKNFT